MARGFGSTLGAGTTDSVQIASFTMPSQVSVWVRYLKNGTGGSAFGRLFEKPGPSTKEITLAISTTTKMFIERDFSGANGVWEFDDPQANTVGLWADVFFTYDDSSTSNDPLVWVNGRSVTVTRSTAPTGTPVNTSGACYVGNRTDSTRVWDGIISKFAMWSTTGGYPEAKSLLAGVDPRNIKPNTLIDFVDLSVPLVISQKYRTAPTVTGTKIRPDRIVTTQGRAFPFGQATASGITGTASITEAGDTVSSTSTLAIAATLASSEAGDTVSSAATLALAASASITEAGDTVASTATLALAATAAITEAGDSLSSTAAASIAAVLAATEAGDASSATAALAIVANASITEAGDTLSATGVGVVTSTGTAAITEADDTAASVATLKIAGAAAITEAGDTTAAIATLAIKATLAANDNDDTLSATATMGTVAVASRSTGSRPSEGTSTLRLNLSGGPRPSAISRGSR